MKSIEVKSKCGRVWNVPLDKVRLSDEQLIKLGAYYSNDGDYDRDEDYNIAYDTAYDEWGFDGVKPVKVKE
jgi:hypothetical protein